MPDGDSAEPAGDEPAEPLEVRLDADFVRAATVKEPSARARMLAQKWAQEKPVEQPFRSWTPAAAEVPVRARRSGRRLWRGLLAVVVLLGLAAGGLALYRPGPGNTSPSAAATSAPPPVLPVGAEPEITEAHPFAGSPAEHYENGVAGIHLPKAAAAGNFTAAEVSGMLSRARVYFIAANLNRTTLLGGPPTAVRALLDPTGGRRSLDQALRAPGKKRNPLNWLTRFKPTETALVGTVIKVHGTTKYSPHGADELDIRMDYLVVYAVRRPRGHEVTRVVVRHIYILQTYRQSNVTPDTFWAGGGYQDAAGAGCDTRDGFLHPSYPSDLTDDGTGPLVDPYDPRPEPPTTLECRRVSRI
jgi:hypothetical protein